MITQDFEKIAEAVDSMLSLANDTSEVEQNRMFMVSHKDILKAVGSRTMYSRDDVLVAVRANLIAPFTQAEFDRWSVSVDTVSGLLVFTYLPSAAPRFDFNGESWDVETEMTEVNWG